jgi:two-component system, OmpR family, response regulator
MLMRILIAEDDPILADGLTRALRASGYAVDHVDNGPAAERALRTVEFDLIILDIGLPGMSGFAVLTQARTRKVATPVLILTAMDGVESRVKGLDLGADDYLVKPFDLPELEARVRALTRRAQGRMENVIKLGTLAFDAAHRSATIGDAPLELSSREVALLEIFLTRAGRVVSKDQIIDLLCEWGEEVSANAVEVYVHRLRKKLEPAAITISTVRGLGYCLDKPADR